MANNDEPSAANEGQGIDTKEIENIKRRLDMLDQRLDNIDSTVSALVERVLNQPIALNITCPKCGKNIEMAIIGTIKPTE